MNIAILDDYFDTVRKLPSFASLAGHSVTIWNDHVTNIDVLADRLKDVEALALIRERTPVSTQLLSRLKNLRIISQRGFYSHIDLEACTQQKVLLSSIVVRSQPSYATAELAWGLIIMALRNLPAQMASLRAGKWQSGVGYGLRGRSLGIYGYGRIGSVVAGYGKAFGMQVQVWGSEESRARAAADGYAAAQSREAFFAECDVVSLHMRLRESTRGMITATDLGSMKPTAVLVNTSRAELMPPGVLESALRAGRPGMAAIDVFEEEPVTDAGHPWLQLPNLICTPHIGYVEHDAYDNQFSDIFNQILAFADGRPINVVNPAALA